MSLKATSSEDLKVLNETQQNERKPLLAGEAAALTTDLAIAEASRTTSRNDKPLPKKQIMLLCWARMVEPIAFFSIFPFINQMVKENGNLDDADVGFYSGLIESLFSLTQMMVMVAWGRASDRFGRKPVLVLSLACVSVATASFGFAKTIWQMILLRCLAGIFAGTIVTIRTMISEHSRAKTQARAFSWFAFTGNMGIFVGPLLGGALAEPARQYHRAFGNVQFFNDFPYALPTIATGALGAVAALTSAIYITETLTDSKKETDSGTKPPQSSWELMKAPGVGMVLYLYAHVMLLAFAYTAVSPVQWFTPVDIGGFGFSELGISLFMGLIGLAQAIWLLVIFPPLQLRYGTGGVMRGCANAYPFLFIIAPLLNLLLRQGSKWAVTAFWVLGPTCLAIGAGVSMSFTAIQLALNDVSPSPQMLGTLNALALALISGLRAFAPVVFTSVFAWGVKYQILWGYLIWLILIIFAAGFTVGTRWLPKSAEGKISVEDDEEAEVAAELE